MKLLLEFPLEIQEKVFERHVTNFTIQNNQVADSFQEAITNDPRCLFNWSQTPEGFDFWLDVLVGEKLGVFYKMFPNE